jgi:hypothetical protein
MEEYSSLDKFPRSRSYADTENSKANISNQTNEIALMEQQAFDYINQSGVETLIFSRVNDLGNVDPVWEEDSEPIYDQPVPIKGQFVPEEMSTALKKWGVESISKFKVNYSRAQLLDIFGKRLIRSGDVIRIPHNTLVQTQNTEFVDGEFGLADKFRVIDAFDAGNFNFRWLYWVCIVELLTADITVRPPDVNI